MTMFRNRAPVSEREIENFYLQVIEKLRGTDSTLEEVEGLLWSLISNNRPHIDKDELERLREDLLTKIAFIPNLQQEIRNLLKKMEDLDIKMLFQPNHQQEIRNMQHNIDDVATLHFMRL